MAIYICGDIHGQYHLYQKMLERIQPGDKDHLYIIGDMIDRGPEGIKIIQDVIRRDNVTCILGNHELMMYDFLTRSGETGGVWTSPGNGGSKTKKEFFDLSSEEQGEIRKFLTDLPLQIELEAGDKKWLLSHSAFLPKRGTAKWKDVAYYDAFNTVWNSPWRFWEYIPLEEYAKDGREHIIGHVPVQRVYAKEMEGLKNITLPAAYINTENHLINIDCGCAAYDIRAQFKGVALCCMNLTKYAEGNTEEAFLYFE